MNEARRPVLLGDPEGAAIRVAIADPALSHAVASAVGHAVEAVTTSLTASLAEELPVVRLRTRRRLDALGAGAFAGAVAVLQVTERNARRLPELVEAVRASGVLGVQLVWNGLVPERARVERHVFAVLERARSSPHAPPVVLAKHAEPVTALRILIANRQRKDDTRP